MTRILESIRFNPSEFRRYAHWTSGKVKGLRDGMGAASL